MPDISVFCPACGRSTSAEAFDSTNSLEKILSVLAYVGLVPAIVFLIVPPLRRKRLVGFHSWQSLFLSLSAIVLAGILRLLFLILSVLPVVGFLVSWLLLGIAGLAIFTLWVVLMVKAGQGQHFELPVIGPFADRLSRG